jgi:transcriptional regulator with XRE-family HTH domain
MHFAWMTIREILAKNLKRARKAAGMSQEELAHRAGIDRTYVSSLERCKFAATVDVVDQMAKALETSAADLLKKP